MRLILIEGIFTPQVNNNRLYDTIEFLEKEMNKVKNLKQLVTRVLIGGEVHKVTVPPNNAESELLRLFTTIDKYVDNCLNCKDILPEDKDLLLQLFNVSRTWSVETKVATLKQVMSTPFLWDNLVRLKVVKGVHAVTYTSNYSNIEY